MSTLKERLDAAKAEMRNATGLGAAFEARIGFLRVLEQGYASGDLVTKEELEAAVAKAVEVEREACAAIVDNRRSVLEVGAELSSRIRARKEDQG